MISPKTSRLFGAAFLLLACAWPLEGFAKTVISESNVGDADHTALGVAGSRKAELAEREKFAQLEAAKAKKTFGPNSPEYKASLATLEKVEAFKKEYSDKVDALTDKLDADPEAKDIVTGRSVKQIDQRKDEDKTEYTSDFYNSMGWVGLINEKRHDADVCDRAVLLRPVVDELDKTVAALEQEIAEIGLGLNKIDSTTKSETTTTAGNKDNFFTTTVVTKNTFGAETTDSSQRDEFAKKYSLIDLDKAAGKLSADAVDTIMREKGGNSERSQQDRNAIVNALYSGESYIDRQNIRVRLSNVVLRPSAASVNRVYFTDRQDGDYFGLSIVSHLLTYNRDLPTDWGAVVSKKLDEMPLDGGLPQYYPVTEQLSFASPDACRLCITEQFGSPALVSGSWKQGYSEQFGVQGADKGFQRFDAAGNLLSGSDSINVSVTQDSGSVKFSYFNATLNEKIFDATVYYVDQKTSPGGSNVGPLLGGTISTLRSFSNAPDNSDSLVELNITAPSFSGPSKQIDVMLTGRQFLSIF